MSSEWKNLLVSELADQGKRSTASGPFGSNLVSRDYTESGVPVIRGGNMSNGRWVGGDFAWVSEDKAEELSANLAFPGEIVFTQRGTLGQVCLVPDGPYNKYVLSQSQMKLRVNLSICDPLFMLYQFASPGQQAYIDLNAIMVGVPHTNLGILRDTPCQVPPLSTQKAIAHILGTLDDKIELNRKNNETLEAMAKALFKSWFVDFDPVRAKAEGRHTGLSAEISDLFPDSFEDSELGEIPSGWKVGTIASSVGEVFDGPHATPKEAEEGNVFLGIKNMTGSSLNLSDVKLIGHDDWSQWTRRVEPRADDIVFTYEAALGLFAVIPHGLKCCLGRRMALIRTKAPNGAPHFWFHQFIAKPFQKVIEERSIHGATVNRTPLTEFPGYPILEPPENLRLAFDHTVSSLWARINAAANQTSSLTSLRDTLLPKLISGELRIPDAEKMLEEVGV
jgi:type I restriction enzyme S subunit